MKRKQLFSILGLIVVLVFSLLLTGCGKQEGSEFIGTWKYNNPKNTESQSYVTIKKGDNDTFIVNTYGMYIAENRSSLTNELRSSEKRSYKTESPATLKNGILSFKDYQYYFNDKELKNNKGNTYTKYSDKVLTFQELNTDGYPEPK